MSSGTVEGTLTSAGTMDLTGTGAKTLAGTLTNAGTLTISGSSVVLNGTLTNSGTVDVTGAGTISVVSAVHDQQPGRGHLRLPGRRHPEQRLLRQRRGLSDRLNDAGTLEKTAGTGTTTIDFPVNETAAMLSKPAPARWSSLAAGPSPVRLS